MREVLALVQQIHVPIPCAGVGQTISEIELGRVPPALAVLLEGVDCQPTIVRIDRNDFDIRFHQQELEFLDTM